MIVWSGLGFLTLLIAAAGGGGGSGIGVAFGGPSDHANVGTGIGLMLAGVVIWFVGQRLNRPVTVASPLDGRPTEVRNRHRFFWIPMQYCGPIASLAGVGALIVALTH
ncbi:hypothetical protein FPZ12_001475 [Amycolatopsis acidicola]|uniref:Uncharacterized protein n=1 Tax=Amycolatopsis acidicola TaxID=2596893 RepID=A0A5N0VKP4_9PSEU|nr:hypothetical protein [Amycolatopsis acidicola]KAA9166889.1 hypothetical protein FPZ12_001475 [Amycolatopsis acidicola]